MSTSEKRYFNLNASLHEREASKLYVKLFGIIDRMQVYDEDVARQKMGSNQFAVLKTRLQQLLLRVLGNFHSERSTDALIRDQLIQASLLAERGMNEAAVRILDKARAKAVEIGRYEIALECIRLQYKADGYGESCQKIADAEREIFFRFKRVSALRALAGKMEFRLRSKGPVRTHAQLEELDEVIRHPDVRFFEEDNDLEYVYWYHYLMSLYYLNAAIPERAHDHVVSLSLRLQIKSGNEDELVYREKRMKVSLLYARCALQMNQMTEAGLAISELEQMCLKGNEMLEFLTIALMYHTNRGDVSMSSFYAEHSARLLKKCSEEDHGSYHFPLLYQLARYYFLKGDFKTALAYSDRFIFERELSKHADFFAAFLLQLMIYFQTDKMALVQSMCRSYYRRVEQCDAVYQTEFHVHAMMRNLNLASEQKRAETYRDYAQIFKGLSEMRFEKTAIRKMMILEWLKSKNTGRSMQSILREEALQNEWLRDQS